MLAFYLGGVVAMFLLGTLTIYGEKGKLKLWDWVDVALTAVFWAIILSYVIIGHLMNWKED